MLQHVAVCRNVLQCVAVCCSVLQSVAECCSVLQCVAVCCSVLQCAAVSPVWIHSVVAARQPTRDVHTTEAVRVCVCVGVCVCVCVSVLVVSTGAISRGEAGDEVLLCCSVLQCVAGSCRVL